jgi:hypothetical protein
MPFQNHITEKDLKAYIPELSKLLWSDEADYSNQKTEAERLVLMDLADRGYRSIDVMPEVILRKPGALITANETSEASPDSIISRSRFVLEVNKYISGGTITIQLEGSGDRSNWENILTQTVTGLNKASIVIGREFRYYRVLATVTGGGVDFLAYMVETTFDRLLSSKWLELILLDRYVEESDQYYLKMMYFKNEYDRLWNRIKIWSDRNNNGELDLGETGKTSDIRMLK